MGIKLGVREGSTLGANDGARVGAPAGSDEGRNVVGKNEEKMEGQYDGNMVIAVVGLVVVVVGLYEGAGQENAWQEYAGTQAR